MKNEKEKTIKAIFFDLGNVIVKFDPKLLEKGFEEYGYKPNGKLEKYIVFEDLPRRYMCGKISSFNFYRHFKRDFKLKLNCTEFFEVWNGMFFPNPEVEEIIKNLKKDYPEIPLILVSDTNEKHFHFIISNYEILQLMDHFVLSYEIGKVKPHPDMYREALALANVDSKMVFYTDDREDLIKKARAMGIRAQQFVSAEALREQLAKFGIKV